MESTSTATSTAAASSISNNKNVRTQWTVWIPVVGKSILALVLIVCLAESSYFSLITLFYSTRFFGLPTPTTTATTQSMASTLLLLLSGLINIGSQFIVFLLAKLKYVLFVIVFVACRLCTLRYSGLTTAGSTGNDESVIVYNHNETDERVFEVRVC